ncbi:MAG: translation initiation factor IF-2 N-terminal domain-containing protein, partial [Helicobacter sp.]|nr:translation initiation factor IF-2 N-terminal domain-containing protein [Helicobacter sp.]
MDKIRISQIAKEIGKTSKEIIQKAQELGFEVKTASSGVTATQAEELYNYILSGKSLEKSQGEVKKENKGRAVKKGTSSKEASITENKETKNAIKKTREKKAGVSEVSTGEIKQKLDKPNNVAEESHSEFIQDNPAIKRTGLRIIKKRDFKEETPKIEKKKETVGQTLQDLLGNL